VIELRLELVELGVVEVFEPHQPIAREGVRSDQLVELQVESVRISVLGVLDEEHHEERHDGRSRVDHELPRVREVEERARDAPHDDDGERADERPGATHAVRRSRCDPAEQVIRRVRAAVELCFRVLHRLQLIDAVCNKPAAVQS
jgi:hypothetical protein